MRFVNADKLIDQIKLQAGCAKCNSYDGVRCRACPWDDAIAIVDSFAENQITVLSLQTVTFQRIPKQKGSETVITHNGQL